MNQWRSSFTGRSFGAGLVIGTITTVVAILLAGGWARFGPYAMSQRGIEKALRPIVAAHREVYYLGQRVDGYDLAAVSDRNGIVLFEYGPCADDLIPCDRRRVTVMSQPTALWGSQGEPGPSGQCSALRPVLGVPAAMVFSEPTAFVGSSIVAVTSTRWDQYGYTDDPDGAILLLAHLRRVGQTAAPARLPSPDPATQAFVQSCLGSGAK